ncbi:HMG domain-containing protein 3 [Antechinus flavipes]|uniref:HMG domain-containing protein 3 n=1 Tax=Antechinus flavipes TaxID=38775 RepID=UPI00223696C1|nr:HMG domain-containing protein 3 [Antechinus flavipes]
MDAPYDGTEVTVVMEEIDDTYSYSSPGPPKKKKKYKIHGEKAKKPRSAYLLYYYDIYLKVQQELPHLPQSEINKKISESWRLLSVAEKSYYLEKAKLEKEGLDPNSKLSALTAVVPDIPGFRKILPRSDYIIIPKSTLQEDQSCQPLELCVTQGPTKGIPVTSRATQEALPSILSMEPSQAGAPEQCITIEGLAEEVGTQPNHVQEMVTSEILSHDVVLEEAALEVGENHPYQTSLVIEETLVSSTQDIPSGSLAVSHPQVGDNVSVVAVVRDSSESSSSAPTTQFIMLPLPTHSVVENSASIKLTTTYTRRGHGNCTSPGCSFTYVTRHKPPKCPTCGNFLGGKWIPKVRSTEYFLNIGSSKFYASFCIHTVTFCDLGLATSRGRGKCKNPSCSYVYTNRHKPRICPSCGYNLAKDRTEKIPKSVEVSSPSPDVLNTTEPLSQAQKEIQRQSTLQLLRKVLQIPENESELAEVFTLIHELNSSRLILSNVSEETVTIEQTSWSNYYESPSTQCLLCSSPLFKGGQNSLAGPQECWLLTANRLQLVTAQVKMCLNPQCLALHSFTDIYTGLFNVGSKLLVSLDLLFAIRNHIKLGEDPKVAISSILESVQEQTEKTLGPEELSQLQELLCSGYWAFECLTVRDYNDMICGVCGVAPKVEMAQRNEDNVLALKNVEFTWPEFLGSSEVNVEDFWSTMETEVIEQMAFPASIPITKFDASVIAPFFPPLMRGPVVVNTEKDKNLEIQSVPGNGSSMVRLLQEGTLKLEEIGSYSKEQLQHLLGLCSIPWEAEETKDQLCYSLLALYESIQNGGGARQPPSHLTGGKIYKVCPHQVICGSKYLVRGESARDHVDLLTSSRHWPPVYVVDLATPVSLCADLCYPELTNQMWGRNQGCFSSPTEPPTYMSCPELLDRHYTVDMTVAEHSVQHPVTKTTTRRIVHTGTDPNNPSDPSSRHHSLSLCRELEPYEAVLTAIADSKTSNIRQRPVTFDNATHYYLYNRLIDFLTSREIVNRQIQDIVQSCQPGEVVIRDTLYRLGVAQIKTEIEEDDLDLQGEERGVSE